MKMMKHKLSEAKKVIIKLGSSIITNDGKGIDEGCLENIVSQICKLNVSKKDVKNVSETSEVTINKCYKKLEKIAKDDMLIPAAILKKYA